MFKFLKGLFKKELEKKEVSTESLIEWFNSKTTNILEEFNVFLKERLEQVKEHLTKIKEDSELLLNAEIKGEEKIDNKVKQVVLGNRNQYIRSLEGFIRAINIPEEINHKRVLEFCADFHSNLELFSKNTVKTYYTVQHLFANEVEAIAKDIKNLDNSVKNIKQEIDASKAKMILLMKKRIKEFKETISKKDILEKELEEKKKEFEKTKELKSDVEKEISRLEQSAGFLEFENKKNKLQETENNIKELKDKIIALFSPLETALKKFKRLAIRETLVNAYIEDTVKALLWDKRLFIIEVLSKMKAAIISDSVILRDKKREKAIEHINEVTEQHLEQLRSSYNGMLNNREELMSQIKADKSMLMKKELDYKLEHYTQKLRRSEQDMADLERKEKIDLEQLKSELEEQIKELVDVDITISF